MKNKELYQATFSQLHTSVDINWEDYQRMKRHTSYMRLFVAAAAAAALLAAMTATALAFNLFGLRDLAFPERTVLHVPTKPDGPEGDIVYEDRVVDMVTMQGYADTPESRACMEWSVFYYEYTSTHTFDNSIYDEDGRYSLYSVYDDTMAEKFDEIVEKYGLQLHQAMYDVSGRDEWLALFGEDFLSENNACFWGYRYDDGTCSFEGEAWLEGYGLLSYQFYYARRGYFDTVALNVGDLSDYAEWTFETKDGVTVSLALGPSRGFIWSDLGSGFLFLNALGGAQGDATFASEPISAREMEQLANCFDFSALEQETIPHQFRKTGR